MAIHTPALAVYQSQGAEAHAVEAGDQVQWQGHRRQRGERAHKHWCGGQSLEAHLDCRLGRQPDGSGTVVTFFGSGGGVLSGGGVSVFGSTIIGNVSSSLLPSTGAPKSSYSWNLWTRDGTRPGGFGQTADFAPDNSNLNVTVIGAVPEPASVAMLAAGMCLLGAVRARRTAQRT